MRFNNQALALLAFSQAITAQEKRSLGEDGVSTPEKTSSVPQLVERGFTEHFSTKDNNGAGSASGPATESVFLSATSTFASAGATVGIETVDFVRISTINEPRKRAIVTVTESVSVAICPIPSASVAGTPCYPCAVGHPQGEQTLFVYTTSVLNAPPDPTPVFYYNFCKGCQASFVTTAVPGYTPRVDSRNFDSCLVSPVDPTSNASLRPSGRPSRSTGLPGLTTTVYVTATIMNQIEVISICSTNGAITTITEQSATCETYSTCVTIPASLCDTFVSTQDNGELTTCTTPVETWTQILATAITSTVQAATADSAAPVQTALPSEYTPVQTVSAVAAALTQATINAGAQGVSPTIGRPTPGSPTIGTPGQTAYVTAGADRFAASLFTVYISLLTLALV